MLNAASFRTPPQGRKSHWRRARRGNSPVSAWRVSSNRARYRQFTTTPCLPGACNCTPPTSTTLYVGDSFERVATNQTSTVQYRHYIRAGSATIAIHTEYSTGTGTSDHYLHHDHLGSVVAMTNAAGALFERFSYDPWGKRRNVGSSTAWSALSPGSYLSPLSLSIQTRGFTNHEHLDKLGLIHMNGRVYDPELGRFISADSVIQFPESTQGLDRYAYVNNNPLSYTDPSGHFIWFVIAAIAAYGVENTLVVMLIAAVAGYLETGTLRGALFSALSAGAASAIGGYFGDLGTFGHELGRALAHGLTQGAIAAAQGGKFAAGALAAAFSSGFGSVNAKYGLKGTDTGSRIARVTSAAVIGGTASKIGGGKFANGAATAAFVQAFNAEAHQSGNSEGDKDLSITDEQRQLAEDGKVREFWDSREAMGDPIAKIALGSLDDTGRGRWANGWLKGQAKIQGVKLDMDSVRLDIMRAHVTATDVDVTGVRGLLNPKQVAEYHHQVFQSHGLGSTAFGGTPIYGKTWEAAITRPIWCGGCDGQ